LTPKAPTTRFSGLVFFYVETYLYPTDRLFDYSEGTFDPFEPGKSTNCTGTPFFTMDANASASQFVSLTQP